MKRTDYAFRTIVAKIDCFTSAKKISKSQYKFIVDGNPVYVLLGSGSIPDEITGSVKVTDIYGNETQMDASELELDNSPIFVEMMSCMTD